MPTSPPPPLFDAPRSPHRRIPVWGFPRGYNPNLMGDACAICRSATRWEGRAVEGEDLVAWTCGCCLPGSNRIPD